jgi:EmrB/QacA subfamily drug resistance transporter
MTEAAARRLTLVATVLGSSLAFIDATVVNVALPVIQRDLDLGLTGQEWVYLAYSLALASLYLAAGATGDRWGRRGVFTWGVIGFASASALAGAAPDGAVLIAARLLQGIAGAFVTTNSLALLRAAYGRDAGRAVGLWTAFTGIATVLGPPAGGALVEWASWRWIFFLNLPLAVATVVLARLGRSSERAEVRVGRLDLPGAVLAALTFGALTFAMVQGSEHGFAGVWWAFVVAAAAAVAFVVAEQRSSAPLLPFELFRRRNFTGANLETFLVYATLGGFFLYLPIYLQFLGFTPLQAGLVSVPTSIVMLFLAARFGALADRYGPRAFLSAGPVLFGAGILLFIPITSKSEFWTYGIAGVALYSIGLAMFVAPITATAISSAPERLAGIASGVNTTFSRLGGLMAVAVMGLVISLVFDANGGTASAVPLAVGQHDPGLRHASEVAFRSATLLAAGLAFAGAALGALVISNADARRESEVGGDAALADA